MTLPAKTRRDATLNVRLTPAGMAKVDELRGSWSRSEWVRQAIRQAVQDGLRGPR